MQKHIKGFTLLEILLVIASIGILASIVLVAVNPTRQIALGRNANRLADVGAIYKAIDQYTIKNQQLPPSIEAMSVGFANRVDICKPGQSAVGCLNIADNLVPNFLINIPSDPSRSTSTSTRYSVVKNLNDTFAVWSEEAELGKEIVAGVVLY
jgi:prepilin-type N-terminal cleavage/methylation domain-containing protein